LVETAVTTVVGETGMSWLLMQVSENEPTGPAPAQIVPELG
jgi:hypothetical protein